MAHQSMKKACPKRVFFIDNYYTRHMLARALKYLTDREARIIRTVRHKYINATNKVFIDEALEMMEDSSRGDWLLVWAYNMAEDLAT